MVNLKVHEFCNDKGFIYSGTTSDNYFVVSSHKKILVFDVATTELVHSIPAHHVEGRAYLASHGWSACHPNSLKRK